MRLPIFFAPPVCQQDNTIKLPAVESRHATKVMRLGLGDPVVVVDGLGMAYTGTIAEMPGRGSVSVRVLHETRNFGEPSTKLTLAAGLSSGSKFDSVVQRGTELGVTRFVPILSEKSLVKLDDARRLASRIKRLENVALAAIKQCRRSYRPEISLPSTFRDFLGETDSDALNLIFHHGGVADRFDCVEFPQNLKRVTALVGPEAGFTDEEVRQGLAAGFQQVSLGARIMRTETAGPVICALIMNAVGELR